jgi:hypothetical protein
MQLTNTLISSFAKLATTENENNSETIIYGEAKTENGNVYIKIDGSNIWSPATTQVNINESGDIKNGDRVSAVIKNHSIIILGNITDPSASSAAVENISSVVADISADIDTEKTDREKAIEVMQENIDSLNGLYFTQDEEGGILWLTNKKNKDESEIQWKITDSAISISTDYGENFNFALDVSGNAILQNIYAVGGLDASYINVGGGSNDKIINVYDIDNNIIGSWGASGLKIFCNDEDSDNYNSYILLDASNGLVGYDANDNKTYWASQDTFHMQNAQVEDEIQLGGKIKIVPINNDDNVGIGFVGLI